MKKLIFTFLLCSIAGRSLSQVITVETGSNTKDQTQAALTAGYVNFKDDIFTAGYLYKRYGDSQRHAIRFNVSITLNDWAYFYTVSDAFISKQVHEATFLEIGSGLGVQFKGLQLSAGYQMNDYNPAIDINREDQILVRLGYNVRFD